MRRGMPPLAVWISLNGLGLELRIVLPADMLQPVLDVASRLLDVERTEVVRGDHPLAQLQHLRALHHLPELRLADQEALQQRVVSSWKFDSMRSSSTARGVRFCASSTTSSARLPCVATWHRNASSAEQQVGLVDVLRLQAERRGDEAQHVLGVELRADELRRDDLARVELVEQAAHDRRLAGADLAGDDDEAFVLVQPVLEVCDGAPVLPAAEVERRIGIELERLAGQAVEGFVHAAA